MTKVICVLLILLPLFGSFPILIFFKKIIYFYLKSRVTQRQTQRGLLSTWFIPQMPATAEVGPDQSRRPRTQCGSPKCVAGTQVLEGSLLPPKVHTSGNLDQKRSTDYNTGTPTGKWVS